MPNYPQNQSSISQDSSLVISQPINFPTGSQLGFCREEFDKMFQAQIAEMMKQENRELQTNYVNLINQIENIRQDVMKI